MTAYINASIDLIEIKSRKYQKHLVRIADKIKQIGVQIQRI